MPIPAAVVNMSNFVMSPTNPRRNHAATVAPGNVSKGIMVIDRQNSRYDAIHSAS
jgi:hypothetical protein